MVYLLFSYKIVYIIIERRKRLPLILIAGAMGNSAARNLMIFYDRKKVVWDSVTANKYILFSIAFPEQIKLLIQSICKCYPDGTISRVAEALNREILEYSSEYRRDLSIEWNIPESVFETADKLYSAFDEAILTASLGDKLDLWKLAFYLSYNQETGFSNVRIMVSLAAQKRLALIRSEQARNYAGDFLNDYVDDFDAWAENYIYDNNSNGSENDISDNTAATASIANDDNICSIYSEDDLRIKRLRYRFHFLRDLLDWTIPPLAENLLLDDEDSKE